MHIVVCMKQVPRDNSVKINPDLSINADGIEKIINLFDEYAIEEGISWNEKHGGKLTILSLGFALGILSFFTGETMTGISFIDGDGRPVTELLEEGLLRIRVHSPSDSAPGGPQTLEVLVTSRHSNDSETVILTETGQGTGIFEGSIRMSTNWPTQGEGTLETGNTGWPQYLGDEVSAFYESASVTARPCA